MSVGVGGDGLHGGREVVGHVLVDDLLALGRGVVQQDLAVGGLDPLDEVGLVVHALVGEGRQGAGHVADTDRVLAQDDAVERVLARLTQRLPLEAGDLLGHARAMRDLTGVIGTVVEHSLEPDERGVEGELEGLRDRARTTGLTADVGDGDVAGGDGRRRHRRPQADPLLERCGHTEDLEHRAGLERRVGVVPALGLLASVVADHPAGAGVDRDHGGAGVGVLVLHVAADTLEDGLLGLSVDGGDDLESARVQHLLVDAGLGQLGQDLTADGAVGGVADVLLDGLRILDDLREHGRTTLLCVDCTHVGHAVHDVVPARL